jgi:hypothetical protein
MDAAPGKRVVFSGSRRMNSSADLLCWMVRVEPEAFQTEQPTGPVAIGLLRY